MERCLLALGGNQKIDPRTFVRAADRLADEGVHVQALASVFRTKPVGPNAGADFLNTAAVAMTELAPAAILQALHRVEASFERVRTIHWGPRTLDLDLLMCGSHVCDTADLVVPHPSMWYRRFVLEPLVEIAADDIHPVFHESIATMWRRLNSRPLLLEILISERSETLRDDRDDRGAGEGGGGRQSAARLMDRLRAEFAAEIVRFELAESADQVRRDVLGQLRLSRTDESAGRQTSQRRQPALCDQRIIRVPATGDIPAVVAEIRQIVMAMTG